MRLIYGLVLFSFFISSHASEVSKELQKKLNVVIPEFKAEDVSLKEAINRLRELSIRFDPDKTGLNIILLEKDKSVKAAPAPELEEDPFAEADPFADPEDFAVTEREESRTFTFHFEKMPVGECIKYICLSMNLKHRIDQNAVVIAEPGIPLNINEWDKKRISDKISDTEYKIKQLKRELTLLQKIYNLPKENKGPGETLKENVIFPKIRFENISLNRIAEFIETQTKNLTKDKKKIPVAVYIPADVKLKKFTMEANNLPLMDFATYVAEQLDIKAAVEKGEITFREKRPVKIKSKIFQLTQKQYMFLFGPELNMETGLKKFGLTFPKKASLHTNGLKHELNLINTPDNHKKLEKILELLQDL